MTMLCCAESISRTDIYKTSYSYANSLLEAEMTRYFRGNIWVSEDKRRKGMA